MTSAADDLLQTAGRVKFKTVLADPPWQFQNRTGKMAPEHRRLSRYPTMTLRDISVVSSRSRFLVNTVGLRPGALPVQG